MSFVEFSRDGSKVLFLSTRMGHSDLWSQLVRNGEPQGEPERVTDLPGPIGTYSLTADGRWLAFHGNWAGRRDIQVVPTHGGPARRLTDSGAANIQPSWAPDGEQIAFVSDLESGFQIWIARVVDGALVGCATRLTSDQATHWMPRWSPDGAQIAYIGDSGPTTEVWIVRADGTEAPRRLTSGAEARFVRWDPSSGDLLVSGAWGLKTTEIRRLSPSGGEAVPVSPPVVFGDAGAKAEFAVSPDGTRIAYREEEVRGEVWVMEASRGKY